MARRGRRGSSPLMMMRGISEIQSHLLANGTMVDTEGNMAITRIGLVVAGGTDAWGETLFYLTAAQTRAAGVTGIIAVSVQTTDTKFALGWRENTGGTYYGVQFDDDGKLYLLNGQAPDAPGLEVGAYGVADYEVMCALRAAGMFLFIKGGAFTDWTLLYNTLTGNDVSLNLAVESYDAALTVTNVKVIAPQTIAPLVSDSFNRADGALGNTDGAGHPEGGAGGGLAWVANLGTFGITSNKARATAVDTNRAIATIDTGAIDVVAEANIESNASGLGFALRWVDADNHIRVWASPGNTARIVKLVGGSETQVSNDAITWSNGARLVVTIEGSAIRVYYNNSFVGQYTVADAILQTSSLHGMYLAAAGSVVNEDNLVIWARN